MVLSVLACQSYIMQRHSGLCVLLLTHQSKMSKGHCGKMTLHDGTWEVCEPWGIFHFIGFVMDMTKILLLYDLDIGGGDSFITLHQNPPF